MLEQNFPVNNMSWFPSLRLSILILLTMIIEVGMVVGYCFLQGYVFDETIRLAFLVIAANMFTGLLGFIFGNLGIR